MKNTQCSLKSVKNVNVAPITSKTKVPQWAYIFLWLILSINPLFAQQAENIDTQLGIWGGQIETTLNIAVGIFAIVGGFIVFIQYMQGNEQAQRNFIRFVIGLAIFGLVTLIANVFIPNVNPT